MRAQTAGEDERIPDPKMQFRIPRDRILPEVTKNMIMVKKRDGRKEPFVTEKIVVSAIKSGAPVEVARAVALDIEKNATDGIATKELKKKKYLGYSRRKIPNGNGTG